MNATNDEFNNEFMRDIPRGIPTRYLKQQSIPQARWQIPSKIYHSQQMSYNPDNPGKKILIGSIYNKLIGIEDNRHILTVAGSRSGKSVSLIGNLLFYRGSVLATDPKGELANITAERRAALGQKVYVLDPFNYASKRLKKFQAGYNPLSVLSVGSATIIEDASLIADAMVVQAKSGSDPHWDESAKNFIEGIILQVVSDPSYEGKRNLVTVRDLIKTVMKPEPLKEGQDANGVCPYALEVEMLKNAVRLNRKEVTQDLANTIEGAARDFFEKSERERDSVLSTARRHTKFLDYTSMRKSLVKDDFSLADLKRDKNGVTVYLCFPATRIEISNRWLRLFINQLLDAMEREKTVPDAPILCCLDEFPVLGYMKQLENAAGQIASFDVKLWVMIQDWNQGKALYGERWETFTGNAGILQFFGNNDLATTEYISKRLGKTRVAVERSGEVGKEQLEIGNTGRTTSIELYDLLTPEEISRQFARQDQLKRQLILWAGYHPIILQRIEYYNPSCSVYSVFEGKYAAR